MVPRGRLGDRIERLASRQTRSCCRAAELDPRALPLPAQRTLCPPGQRSLAPDPPPRAVSSTAPPRAKMPGEPERRPYHTELYLLGRLEKQQKRRDGVRSTARKVRGGRGRWKTQAAPDPPAARTGLPATPVCGKCVPRRARPLFAAWDCSPAGKCIELKLRALHGRAAMPRSPADHAAQ